MVFWGPANCPYCCADALNNLVLRIPKNNTKQQSRKKRSANRGGRGYGSLNIGDNRGAKLGYPGLPGALFSSITEPRRARVPEVKYVDTNTTSTVATSTPLVLPLNLPAQGTNAITRLGNSIDCVCIEGNLEFIWGSGTTVPANSDCQIFRWFLTKYNKTVDTTFAAPPSINTFLNTDAAGFYSPMSLPNPEHEKDWTIMASGQVELQLGNWISANETTTTKIVPFRVKSDFPIDFDSSGGGSVCNNLPFLIVVAQYAVNGGGVTIVGYNIRVEYTDA